MGILCLLLTAVLFSFSGLCAKLISPYFLPPMVSFLRFFVGVLWLLAVKLVRRRPFRADFRASLLRLWPWLLLGAAGKWIAYLTENTGLALGLSYGNILTTPVQLVFLTLVGVFVLREALSRKEAAGVALCLAGILMISANDAAPASGGALPLNVLFVISGMGSGVYVLAQRRAARDFDILDSNLTMFAAASILSLPQPLLTGGFLPRTAPDGRCLFAVLFLGFITGIGYLLNAAAIPRVPFHMVPLLQTSMIFFSILWGVLFFGEAVGVQVFAGAACYVAGVFCMRRKRERGKG